MNDPGEFHEVESNCSGTCSHVCSQQGFQVHALCQAATDACHLTRGIDLDHRKTFLPIHVPHLSHHKHPIEEFINLRHQVLQVRLVAREEERSGNTIPMSTFARRPPTMSSFSSAGIPQSSMVGQ